MLFAVCSLLIFLTACSSRLPKPEGDSKGLLVVLLEGKTSGYGGVYYFLWKYGFSDGDKPIFLATIEKRKHFLAQPMEAGTYSADTFQVKAGNDPDSEALSDGWEKKLKSDIEFEIKPGTITFFPMKLEAVLKLIEEEDEEIRLSQIPNLKPLTPKIKEEYMEILKKSSNFDKWKLN